VDDESDGAARLHIDSCMQFSWPEQAADAGRLTRFLVHGCQHCAFGRDHQAMAREENAELRDSATYRLCREGTKRPRRLITGDWLAGQEGCPPEAKRAHTRVPSARHTADMQSTRNMRQRRTSSLHRIGFKTMLGCPCMTGACSRAVPPSSKTVNFIVLCNCCQLFKRVPWTASTTAGT
jgi:hypothetical protein